MNESKDALTALIETSLREAREQILDLANARWSECEATEQELVGHIDKALDALVKEAYR